MNGQQVMMIDDMLSFAVSKIGKIPIKYLLFILKEFYPYSEAYDANKRLLMHFKNRRQLKSCHESDPFLSILKMLCTCNKDDMPTFLCRNLNNVPDVKGSIYRRYIMKGEHEAVKKKVNKLYCIVLSLQKQFQGIFKETSKKSYNSLSSTNHAEDINNAIPSQRTSEISDLQQESHENFEFQFKSTCKEHEKNNGTLANLHLNVNEEIDDDGSKTIYQCTQCHLASFDRTAVKEHVCEKVLNEQANHLGDKKFSCQVCNSLFTSSKNLKIHQKLHKKAGFCCPLCTERFKEKEWKNHVGKCYGIYAGLTPTMIYCVFCDVYFANAKLLKLHQALHDQSRPFECQNCFLRFYSSKILLNHHKIHVLEKDYKLKCPFCPKAFPTNRKLEYHIRIHTGERPFKCKLCDFSATRHSGLQAHYKSHSDKKKFQCNICLRSFKFKSKLDIHKKTHTEDRPYICEYCGKSFKTGYSMAIHHKDHSLSSVKPYLCTIPNCTYSTRSIIAFHGHTNSHFNVKPHKCPFCPFAANQKSYLNAHLKKCNLAIKQ